MRNTEFRAIIKKRGINPYVDIPLKMFKSPRKGYVPVAGRLNEVPIQSTLVPIGNGRYILYLNGDMRKAARVEVGDKVRISISVDKKPRIVAMPRELRQALDRSRKAKAAFVKLPPSHRKEILTYLNYLKTNEALERNIKKLVSKLTHGLVKKV